MVLFSNINIKARVQVKWRGEIFNGTVRYTGGLVARSGEWVGVELDERVGDSSGLYKGIQYFHCRQDHGVFVQARNIRFIPSQRLKIDRYKVVAKDSIADELLFTKCEAPPVKTSKDPEVITLKYLEEARSLFTAREDPFLQRKSFHKSHFIGGRLAPATQRPMSAQPAYYNDRQRTKLEDRFISSPSIPDYHVPRPTLKRMIRMDYFGTSIPRHTSLS